MRSKKITLSLFAVLMILMVTLVSVSAQDIDVDSMDNEQLTALLLQILGKLQQEGEPEKEGPDTAAEAAAEPAADPDTIEEVVQITIYDNKKLQIESLPSYMFIQPTQPPKPDRNNGSSTSGGSSTHEDLESYCTDKCMGYSDFYGKMMLDMGCYAKCVGDI